MAADRLLHQHFETQVASRPDAIALRSASRTTTYSQLDHLADAVAERLLGLWTAKEAVAKALGLGFSLPFHLIQVGAKPEDGRPSDIYLSHNLPGGGLRWRLATARPTPVHMATLAVGLEPDQDAGLRIEFLPRTWARTMLESAA